MIIHQNDSIAESEAPEVAAPIKVEVHYERPRQPYEVLKELPRDATPAQQDSAIQAVFHVENKHLSTRPDTLHLPGHEIGKSIKDVSLPKYYRQNFFSNDSLFHPEIDGGRYGVAGDPMPYTVRADDTLTGLLIGGFIIALTAFAKSRRFFARQAKDFVREPINTVTEFSETSGELRFQVFLVLEACLMLSIISFLYTLERIADTFILQSQYQLIAIFFGVFAAYFGLKTLAYWCVNNVFFGRTRSVRWQRSMLFVHSLEGMMLFPLVMLQSYFDLGVNAALAYLFFVLLSVKIMFFYKAYTVFFKQKPFYLQIILYFCALEIVPLFTLYGVLVKIVDYFKINF